MKDIFIRSPYNYDMDEASYDSGLKCEDPSLAQQQFAEECDINTIVERFHLTGEVPQLQNLPNIGDYEGIFDFQTAMNQVVAAREQFMTLPAELRARFDNEPQKFLEFCSDDKNMDEAEKMGILNDEALKKRTEARAAAEQAKIDAAIKADREKRPAPEPDNKLTR